ncbi:hypothetical protein M3Y97_00470500 [Aphelenchoides bicaudatus]|nr:hypothetical protein M3Y97_00470500 [Aphelenchoides bicaudatus]
MREGPPPFWGLESALLILLIGHLSFFLFVCETKSRYCICVLVLLISVHVVVNSKQLFDFRPRTNTKGAILPSEMREINEHVVQNAQTAQETVKLPVASSTAANCPSGGSSNSTTPAVSPLFEGTFVPGLHFDLDTSSASAPSEHLHIHQERKRRRIIGNLDNTLDGLVAKRSDLEPNTKRYQTETEAIELPDDEIEAKRLETDPDVSTRMCSICGYQGKWVSEMIRHKRVHTSERPFKCKYCNRTSKWKADLIRHVAKTHGIRVVSKYSRSKAFDSQSGRCDDIIIEEEPKTPKKRDLNNNKQSNFFHSGSVIQKPLVNHSIFKPLQPMSPFIYKCQSCLFEQDSMEVLVQHLRLVHELAPFECRKCNLQFGNVQQMSAHCANSETGCTPLHVKINFQISNQNAEPRSEGLLTVATNPLVNTNNLSIPATIDSDTASSAPSSCGSSIDVDSNSQHSLNIHSCNECPYRTPSLQKLDAHRVGHQAPRGLFNYKCVFCNWFAKKKSAIEKHMQIHTSKPSQFMQQVERNLITPLTTAPINLGGASAPVQQPNFLAPITPAPNSAATAFGLLSALYSANGNNLLAMGGSSPVNTSPDVGAFKELTTNPLLAFSLCSLLRDNLANQAQQTPLPFIGSTPPGLLQAASTRLSAFDFPATNLN